MLERVGGQLISATEAFACDDRPNVMAEPSKMRLYCSGSSRLQRSISANTIVVAFEAGTMADASFTEVPAVRFLKRLSARPPATSDAAGCHSFASHLAGFVQDIDVDSNEFRWLR